MVLLGNVIKINPNSIKKDFQYDEIEYIDISSVGTAECNGARNIKLENAPSRAKRLVIDEDTIIATVRPNLRSFYFIKKPKPNTVVSTGFAVLRATEKINRRFLYYIVSNQQFTDYLTLNAKGSAYPAVDTKTIARALVYLPLPTIQRKIASILSAYDDLIENNLRRIQILEETTQMIYREWFVNFRFPGYEKVKIDDSPMGKSVEGWDTVLLGDHISLDKGVSYKGKYLTEDGMPMVNLKCIRAGGGFQRDGTKPYSGDYKDRHSVRGGDLVFANTDLTQAGNIIGSPAIVPYKGFAEGGLASHHICIVRKIDKSPMERLFLYYTMHSDSFKGFIKGVASGTTVLGLRKEDALKFSFLQPSNSLLEKFEDTVSPLHLLAENLVNKNDVLRQSRDYLLPKLISGELDVENLDIDVPGATLSKEHIQDEESQSSQINNAIKKKTKEVKSGTYSIDEYEKDEIMAIFRQTARSNGIGDRDDLLKAVSFKLGYKRRGPRIDEALRGHMRAAIRRKIVGAQGTEVWLETSSMDSYEKDELIQTICSVMRKNYEYDRDEVIRSMAHYLGFRRLYEAVITPIKSAINSAIRQGLLKYEGSSIWRIK